MIKKIITQICSKSAKTDFVNAWLDENKRTKNVVFIFNMSIIVIIYITKINFTFFRCSSVFISTCHYVFCLLLCLKACQCMFCSSLCLSISCFSRFVLRSLSFVQDWHMPFPSFQKKSITFTVTLALCLLILIDMPSQQYC